MVIKETYGWRETKQCSGCGDTLVNGKCPSCGVQREEFVKISEERTSGTSIVAHKSIALNNNSYSIDELNHTKEKKSSFMSNHEFSPIGFWVAIILFVSAMICAGACSYYVEDASSMFVLAIFGGFILTPLLSIRKKKKKCR